MTCSMCFPSIVLMPFTKLLCLKPSVDAATANSHLSPQPSSKSTGTNSSTYKVKNKEFETGNSPCQPSLPVEEIKTGIFSTDFKNPPIQAPPWTNVEYTSSILFTTKKPSHSTPISEWSRISTKINVSRSVIRKIRNGYSPVLDCHSSYCLQIQRDQGEDQSWYRKETSPVIICWPHPDIAHPESFLNKNRFKYGGQTGGEKKC